jgi:hypothetical protein
MYLLEIYVTIEPYGFIGRLAEMVISPVIAILHKVIESRLACEQAVYDCSKTTIRRNYWRLIGQQDFLVENFLQVSDITGSW